MFGTKTNKTGYWKVRGHVFGSDTYVCSCCGRESGSSGGSTCPGCGASMSGSRKDSDWIDEMETMDAIFGK